MTEHLVPHPTEANPTGVVSYRIPRALHALPEWRNFVDMLNLCALASGGEALNQNHWLRAVSNTAAGVAFMDRCERCANTSTRTMQIEAPIEVEASRSHIQASYCCPRGHEWQTRWTKRRSA